MEKPSRSLVAGSAATLLGTAISALLSVAYVSLGARWLGPARYAGVAAAISTANIIFIALNPVEAGLTLRMAGHAGRGELSLLHDFLRRSLRGVALVGAPLLAAWLAYCALSGARGTSAWLGLFCGASMLANVPRAALRGRELFGAVASNWILESAVRLGLGLLLVKLGFDAAGMVAGYALGALGAIAHAYVFGRRGLPGVAATEVESASWLSDLSGLVRAISPPMLGLHVYTALMVNLDVLAANHYLRADEAGLYGGATSIARIVLVGAHPLLLVLFSRLASMSAARADTAATLRLGASVVLGGLSLSMLIPWLGSELLLRAFLGSAYSGAASVLFWQWATACALIAQAFFAESMLATSNVRGAALFALPALALPACLWAFHDSALTIARVSFGVCALPGTVALVALWRWRTPHAR